MNKLTFTLCTLGGSLAAMIMFANTAFAAPLITTNSNPVFSTSSPPVVNLNQVNSHLSSAFQQSDPIQEHLGCSCSICTGTRY